jgi:uncharacterized Tic20 family protein
MSNSPRSMRAAMLAHLSSVAAAVLVTAATGLPLAWAATPACLGPLLAWLAAGRHDAFVRAHALEAVRFDLSIALYLAVIVATLRTVGGGPYTVQLVPFALFVSLLLVLNWLMFTAMAAHRAATGQLFSYPLALRAPSHSRLRSSH